ncbi:hypothetical protein EFL96_12700 [Lactococcus lactis]|uniref:hypothetical protein n=1 Tax=Lactococcus lactis TaxID=1358 RepID=UPI0013C7B9F4|nr:hypothetical protein [Lactococcus lactis]MCT1185727.1 hypothetical protein [Lactococcus lactis]MCT1190736.1 hypothetical protein [Lactococcus lactis]NEX52818.1 hypothetical protein [Lactococcus lactis]
MNNKRISEIVDEEMIKQDANRYRDMRKILTIPKSIAESNWMKHLLSCDLSQFEFERFDEFLNKEDEQFLKWVNTGKNENILYIYLAGKALGVDLVKVV